jgi:hypothetical protein
MNEQNGTGGEAPREDGIETLATNLENSGIGNILEGSDTPVTLTAGLPAEGADVSASPEEEAENDEAEEEGFGLGDRIRITTRAGETTGTVYHYSETLLRIMPDGLTNLVVDFPIVDGDFDPELNIAAPVKILSRGPDTSFVAWQGYRVGQVLNTFKKDGTFGDEVFIIKGVDEERDSIRVEDATGAEKEIVFDYRGIPLDENFTVMQLQTSPEKEDKPMTEEEVAQEEVALAIAQTPGAQAQLTMGADEEDEGFDLVPLYRIELQVTEMRQLEKTERIYSEYEQKNEMYRDLTNLLSLAEQRNPAYTKRIRMLVEMLAALSNDIILRGPNGIPEGEKQISLNLLSDALKDRSMPLARPILETARKIMMDDFNEEQERIDPGNFDPEQFTLDKLFETVDNSNKFMETYGGIPAEVGVGMPQLYQALNIFFERYPLGDQYQKQGFQFPVDAEYFRYAAPGDPDLLGLYELSYTHEIPISLRRAHGPTHYPLEKGGIDLLIPADRAKVKGYVLFPYEAVKSGTVGAHRTGKFWDIFQRSTEPLQTMEQLLKKYEGVTDEADSKKIFQIQMGKDSSLRIRFVDYLKNVLQTLVPRGPGDLFAMKYDMGIQDMEVNLEQEELIGQRIQEVLASLREHIRIMREELSKQELAPVLQSLLGPEFLTSLEQKILSHPALVEIITQVGQRTPGYKKVDLAIVSSLILDAQDYIFAVMGGNPKAIERERVRFLRNRLMKTLQEAQQLLRVKRMIGEPPQPNTCEHVAALDIIRREEDESKRMALLNKFYIKFREDEVDNWITCVLCKQNLICKHEVLQIQQFLHPQEKEQLQKLINLHFPSRGYDCPNCGRSKAEMDFDKNLEFDDEGRPMMGRDVMVDHDAQEREAVAAMFGIKPTEDEDIEFETTIKNEFYHILRILMDTVGVRLDGDGIQRFVDYAEAEYKQLPSPDMYAKMEKQARATKDKMVKLLNYNQFIAQEKIGIAAALYLLEIQTQIPDYPVRFVIKGCEAGFSGYPLLTDVDPADPQKSIGIHYVSCAISNIYRNDELPWKDSFQLIKDEKRRKEAISRKMAKFLIKLAKYSEVARRLDKKRRHIEEFHGVESSKGLFHETLPAGFLPHMESNQESLAAAAGQPTVAEGAKGLLGDLLKADAWIRAANILAKSSALIHKGSPFAETSCCAYSVGEPGKYWTEASLPPMPALYHLKPGYAYQSIINPTIFARPLQTFKVIPSVDTAFPIFLKICYRGAREGLPHEFGYDNKCDWCGLEIPTEFRFPDVDKNGSPIIDESALRSALDLQGIQVNEQTFTQLLDAAHRHMLFQQYMSPNPASPAQLLDKLSSIATPPVESFKERLDQAMKLLTTLPEAASDLEIQQALLPLSDAVEEQRLKIFDSLRTLPSGATLMRLLESIPKEPVDSVLEIVRSYFLIPAQRILEEYEAESMLAVQKEFRMEPLKVKVFKEIFSRHTSYLRLFDSGEEENEDTDPFQKAKYKLEAFVSSLSELLSLGSELRLSRLKYDPHLTTKQLIAFMDLLMMTIVYGPLGDLLDVSNLPQIEGVEFSADAGLSDSEIQKFIATVLEIYKRERLGYNPDEVRRRIEESKEEEKQTFIGKLDKLSEIERKVQIQFRQLGISSEIWKFEGKRVTEEMLEGELEHLETLNALENGYGAELGAQFEEE